MRSHIYTDKKCVHTVQKCNYIEPTHVLKKLEIDIALIMSQILNDAFKIQIHSKSSEF